MRNREIIISILRKHFISRKIAEEIATEIEKSIESSQEVK